MRGISRESHHVGKLVLGIYVRWMAFSERSPFSHLLLPPYHYLLHTILLQAIIYLSITQPDYLRLSQYTVDIFPISNRLLLRPVSEKTLRTSSDVKLQWLQKNSSITFADTVSRHNSKHQYNGRDSLVVSLITRLMLLGIHPRPVDFYF